jgi:hypothetical protein
MTEEIERLKNVPPKPKRTRWQLVGDIALWVCSVFAVISLTIVVLVVWRDSVAQSCLKGWAQASTERAGKLSPTANQRVDLLLRAFFDAAAGPDGTQADRARAVDTLNQLRPDYPGLPSKAEAAQEPTRNLVADIELVRALQANAVYQRQLKLNPIPHLNFDCELF